ncbi:MAG: hypothetical protein GY913_27235 [Proteobacteria bacterium]|nr:hypothetical protein [Pseudomonadota bacterium]MCP4920609.1 hypothetical protein [Pseudomonadota bacterium]
MLLALISTFVSPASAQDCDARQLEKDLVAASPNGMPAAFEALAVCSPDKAKAKASVAFEKTLSGEGGNAMVVNAVKVGAGEEARAWIGSLQSDERSRTIAALGAACGGEDAVAGFLVETGTALGDSFWTDRWYRSLAECRHPDVQAMLTSEVAAKSDDRTRFFGVLEVYSRNLGADAIPVLTALLSEVTDEEELTYVVNSFADAAWVGSLDGQDAETTKLAVAAIVEAAPNLPTRAVEQSRTTLTSLGAQTEADALVAVRYKDVLQDDGLHWGVVVIENAVCKNDKVKVNVHTGQAIQAGSMWPDQVGTPVHAAAMSTWEYPLAKKCEVTHELWLADTPMAADGLETWTAERLRDADKAHSDAKIIAEELTLAL